jgi:hypothetical protein
LMPGSLFVNQELTSGCATANFAEIRFPHDLNLSRP